VKPSKKKPGYSYSYNPATELYSMDGKSLTLWLMDIEGRAKLEKALEKACDMIDAMTPDLPPELTVELRKLLRKKEKV
jgi:hypothetical protein